MIQVSERVVQQELDMLDRAPGILFEEEYRRTDAILWFAFITGLIRKEEFERRRGDAKRRRDDARAADEQRREERWRAEMAKLAALFSPKDPA